MHLLDHPSTKDWIQQFEVNDRPAAVQLLRSLRLVSLAEAEVSIKKMIDGIVSQTTGKISVFPVSKVLFYPRKRPRFGSEGRIGHILESMERFLPRRIMVSPTVVAMKATRTRHMVLVDDIIGSGTRLETYLKEKITKKEKAWLSLKYMKLWIVTYAAHQSAVASLKRLYPLLERATFISNIELTRLPSYWAQDTIGKLCLKYGGRTAKPSLSLGYGQLPCTIVFEWSAPNNLPAILCVGGKDWKPLFPERAIPSELHPCFAATKGIAADAQLLWESQQYKLAIRLLDETSQHRRSALSDDSALLVIVLGLLLKRVKASRLHLMMLRPQHEIADTLEKARSLGLVDAKYKPNDYARDLLMRFRRKETRNQSSHQVVSDEHFYYPIRYKGSHRA